MEAAGFAFGVIAVFKDVYLTTKFIKKTASTIKDYHGEQEKVVVHLTVQIYRLKNLSRLFRGDDGNKVDRNLLETVPDQYLQTVRDVLEQLRKVLADYTHLAAVLDEDYKKYSPLSLCSPFDPVENTLLIDDNVESVEGLSGHAVNASEKKGKLSLFLRFGRGRSKAAISSSRGSLSLKKLHPGVQWLFAKGKLEETLRNFEEWNKDLEYLIGPLLDGFGFFRNRSLQERLQPDGSVNIFQGHIEVHSATLQNSNTKGLESSKDDLLLREDPESRMAEPRVLIEYKQTVVGDNDLSERIKELYAPQLAQLLRTAGKHDFRTLPLKSYAWEKDQSRYIFLFDYPKHAGDREPLSLHDLIMSSKNNHQFKLELKQRFHVAQTVVRTIGAFHSDGWLHKSIRAQAIKFFFRNDAKTCDFDNAYLTDFGFARPVSGSTRLVTVERDIDQEIYRHPDRWDPPRAGFSQIHDIYSLGVVLLEIGLWQTARQIHDDVVEFDLQGALPTGGISSETIKKAFLQDAGRLAHRMGLQYQEAVLTCLEGDLDAFIGSRAFSCEFQKRIVQKVDIKAFLS